MPGVIFKRPVRFGDKIYPASPRSVEIDAKHMDSNLMKYLIENGEAILPQAAKPAKMEEDKEEKKPSKSSK